MLTTEPNAKSSCYGHQTEESPPEPLPHQTRSFQTEFRSLQNTKLLISHSNQKTAAQLSETPETRLRYRLK